ncbi:MFS transporter [Burkholderia gladioli]|uniref:MFS transporter n=1 Tax=Burkholderia gladioli TaxID=28095 RepID=UPI001FC94750|nr:MFS transporter [Burkholderia gladioli]
MSSTPDFDNAAREAVLADPAPLHGSRPGAASAAPAGAQALHALLTPRLVLLLAAAAGLGVAPLYYSQPMLGVLGPDIGASARMVGLVPTLTQLGYAIGILLLAPLGDRFDRRRVILVKAGVLVAALLVAAISPSIGFLLAASFAVGLAATLAQDVVPAAATLAPDAHRGKVVGTVMTGLLLGILLSRVVAGVVAGSLGWRATFVIAAASVAAIGLAAARGLPSFRPTTRMPYRELIASLGGLWRRHPALRRAAFAQGILALGFSAFWTTLAVMLHGAPFHLGSAVAGAFGLAGAAGALAAPLAGRLADRRGPEFVTRLGIAIATVSFAAMWLAPWLSVSAQLALIALATVGFDLGFQSTLIAHQTIVYGIDPASRSRLNAVLFVGMFVGMSTGAAIGTLLFAQWGWTAVVAMAVLSSIGALLVRVWRRA